MASIKGWLAQAGATKIRDSGDGNLVATCPFHKETKPSFCIHEKTGIFVCYSVKCGVTGNIVNFLMSALHWPYEKALKVAEDIGSYQTVDIQSLKLPPYDQRREREEPDVQITEGHLGLYDFCPKYLLDRGFTKKTLKAWNIGYDYGTDRVVIPVRDWGGKLVGVTKRSTRDWDSPKYLHLGFRKGRYLYGRTIERPFSGRETRTAVVGEGQLDAVAMWQMMNGSGRYQTEFVSTMGARVSDDQLDLLVMNFSAVILAFDNDDDGVAATVRCGRYLSKKMNRGTLYVARKFPKKVKDPAEMLKLDPKLFSKFMCELELYDNVWPSMMGLGGRYK